jgi:hypothetical protein
MLVGGANAQTIIFDNGGGSALTTGDLLDEVPEAGLTTNVVEISGLNISARPGAGGQKINTTATSLGVTIFNSGDDADRFDDGEVMILSFDKKIEITEFDMVGFDSNSAFSVEIDGLAPIEITYEDLPNKVSQYFTTNLIVDANTDIQFYVGNSNSVIGLQSMDVNVLDGSGELFLTLETSNSMMFINADFDGAATTNYMLQSCTNMVSNVWNDVSAFSADTNWSMGTEEQTEYFRVIIEE